MKNTFTEHVNSKEIVIVVLRMVKKDLQQLKPIVVYMSNARIFKSFSFGFLHTETKSCFLSNP